MLQPRLREHAQTEAQKREEESFAALPMNERRGRVVKAALGHGRALGFRGYRSGVDPKDFLTDPRWAAVAEYGTKLSYDGPNTARTVWVVAVPKLLKGGLRAVRDEAIHRLIDGRRAEAAASAGKAIANHAIVISFAAVSPILVGETLPSFKRDSTLLWPAWSEVVADWSTPSSRRRTVKVHVLDNIRSEPQAREALKQVLSSIKLSRK